MRGKDGLPARLPYGRDRASRPGDVSASLTGRWGVGAERLLHLLGDIAEGRYIPRRDMKTGELIPGEEAQTDPSRFPSLELQARAIGVLVERIKGKVPDVLVTSDATPRAKLDLSKFKSREDLKLFKQLLQDVAPTREEARARGVVVDAEVVK